MPDHFDDGSVTVAAVSAHRIWQEFEAALQEEEAAHKKWLDAQRHVEDRRDAYNAALRRIRRLVESGDVL